MPTPRDISTFNHLAKHGWVFLRKTLSRVPHWMHAGTGLRAQNKTHAVAMNTSIPKNFTVASEAEIQRLCDNLRGMPVLDASGKNLGRVVRAWPEKDARTGTVFVKAEMLAKGQKHSAVAAVACLNLPSPIAQRQEAIAKQVAAQTTPIPQADGTVLQVPSEPHVVVKCPKCNDTGWQPIINTPHHGACECGIKPSSTTP